MSVVHEFEGKMKKYTCRNTQAFTVTLVLPHFFCFTLQTVM